MVMKKKSQIEMQFSWIYMAIVGGIFLIIFFSVMGNVRETSRENLNRELREYLDPFGSGDGSGS